jgi:hypothetical protein
LSDFFLGLFSNFFFLFLELKILIKLMIEQKLYKESILVSGDFKF